MLHNIAVNCIEAGNTDSSLILSIYIILSFSNHWCQDDEALEGDDLYADDSDAYYIMIRKPEELMPPSCLFDSLDRAEADRSVKRSQHTAHDYIHDCISFTLICIFDFHTNEAANVKLSAMNYTYSTPLCVSSIQSTHAGYSVLEVTVGPI